MQRLDLNLLVTLEALLIELNVTRAAERLHLSQPAVSVQLRRLRAFFGDPLLLPGPRGMRPTARAEALREPLRLALSALEHAVAPLRPFDPAHAKHTWRIAAFDYGEYTVLQPALAGLRRAAPATRLAIVQTTPAQVARMAEQGDIDLALKMAAGAPSALHRRRLFDEHYVLAGRAGHPQLKRRPTLAQFCQLDHAIVSPDGGGLPRHHRCDVGRARSEPACGVVGTAFPVSGDRTDPYRPGGHGAGTVGTRQRGAARGPTAD